MELLPYILGAVLAAIGAWLGWAFRGRRAPKPKPKPTTVELVETEPDYIEVIDDDPTPPAGPPLRPADYPDDDPAVVDQLSKWADDV